MKIDGLKSVVNTPLLAAGCFIYKNRSREVEFIDICDVSSLDERPFLYQPRTLPHINQGFSFRTQTKDEWVYISGQTVNYTKLVKNFLHHFMERRCSMLYDRLKRGETIEFHKMAKPFNIRKASINSKKINQSLESIYLTPEYLTVDGQKYPVTRIKNITTNGFDALLFQDNFDQELFRVPINTILSLGVLQQLIIWIQEKK